MCKQKKNYAYSKLYCLKLLPKWLSSALNDPKRADTPQNKTVNVPTKPAKSRQILPQTGHCRPLWLIWMSRCGAAGWTWLNSVFLIFHYWHGDFVNLVLVPVRSNKLIVYKRHTEHSCSQRILYLCESASSSDFSPVPFSHWSTDMLNCLRQIFTVPKSILWFWCLSLPFTHFTVKQLL